MSYSLIIPIFNEEKTLKTLLSQIETLNDNIEIILINDGSNDRTKEILKSYHNLKIINHSKNLGKGSSLISGVTYATNKNVIFMDGDLEIKIDCISNAIKVHNKHQNSIIIGNRWNNQNKKEINFHTIGNIIINFFFNSLYKTTFKDILCCLKLIDKSLFDSLNIYSSRFSIEAELMAKIATKRLKVEEIDVDYVRRTKKEGKKLKLVDGFSVIKCIMKIKYF
jgi:glycosyltransferase involved in cell wall biosynthesis